MTPIRLAKLHVATLALASAGCAPIVDVHGVFFPGWLVSAIAGVVAAYAVVWSLGKRERGAGIVESGVFFVGLMLSIGLGVWWTLFSGLEVGP